MRILSSQMNLAATSLQQQRQHDASSIQTWGGQPRDDDSFARRGVGRPEGPRTGPPALAHSLPDGPATPAGVNGSAVAQEIHGDDEALTGDPLLDRTLALLEKLFGFKVRMVRVRMDGESAAANTPAPAQPPPSQSGAPAQTGGAGGEIRIEHVAERYQRLEVSAHVKLQLDDGTVVEADLAALMEHSEKYSSTTTIGWGAAKPIDPIFLALNGGVADLAGTTWKFDLNADGTVDNLAAPAAGTVMLARDANGDGQIVDGSEVLGTKSGNAYADLAALDSDGNGWIDEGDEAWSSLRVVDPNGSMSLDEAGVGALSVQSVAASYTHGDLGATTGQTREVGVFVRENGTLGVASRLDLMA